MGRRRRCTQSIMHTRAPLWRPRSFIASAADNNNNYDNYNYYCYCRYSGPRQRYYYTTTRLAGAGARRRARPRISRDARSEETQSGPGEVRPQRAARSPPGRTNDDADLQARVRQSSLGANSSRCSSGAAANCRLAETKSCVRPAADSHNDEPQLTPPPTLRASTNKVLAWGSAPSEHRALR
jgi:hypothetical protein